MPKSITISLAIYQRLLAFYPSEYRREYGGEMAQLFRDQCRDAWAVRKCWGLAALWFRVLLDLAKTSTAEHLRAPFRVRTVFLRTFILVFVLVFADGVLFPFFAKPYYESTATVDPRAFHQNSHFMVTQALIIRSDYVLTNAVATLQLPNIYSAFQNDSALLPLLIPPNSNPDRRLQAYLYLYRHVSVDLVPKTQLLQITVRLHNRYLASNLANRIASTYADDRAKWPGPGITNAEAKSFILILDPARPARKPSFPDASDLTFPLFAATSLAAIAPLLALAILSLTKLILKRPNAPI